MTSPFLTIGMATYDDADGVYFTIQALRTYHAEVMDQVEFVVIDNHPDGPHGKALAEFMPKVRNGRLLNYKAKIGTSVRDQIFVHARGEFVLSVDCHVLLLPGSLARLIEFYKADPTTVNLHQGPMQYDELEPHGIATNFRPRWEAEMYGVWEHDPRGNDPNGPPFEIPMQGLGLFSCRRDAWLKFNPQFLSFGGEEGYIHEKFRKAGRKCLCLPFLRWIHKFIRPNGIKYPNIREDRMFNYFLGWHELGLDESPIVEHFSTLHPRAEVLRVQKKAHDAWNSSQKRFSMAELQAVARETAMMLRSMSADERVKTLGTIRDRQEALFAIVSYELAKLDAEGATTAVVDTTAGGSRLVRRRVQNRPRAVTNATR